MIRALTAIFAALLALSLAQAPGKLGRENAMIHERNR